MPWVQVAIDTLNLEDGIKLARLAVRAGADWIEAGTPLIVFEGIRSIRALAGVSNGRPIVADFKAQDGTEKYFIEAGRQGAKIATVLGVVADASVLSAVRGGRKAGVEVAADMYSVKTEDLGRRAFELQEIGVDYIMLHLGHDEAQADTSLDCLDGLEEILSSVSLPVGVGTFGIEEAVEAVKRGASFVVQGNPILSSNNAETRLAEFIEAVKGAV